MGLKFYQQSAVEGSSPHGEQASLHSPAVPAWEEQQHPGVDDFPSFVLQFPGLGDTATSVEIYSHAKQIDLG